MREKPVGERVTKTLASVGTTAPLCSRFQAVWQAGGVPRIEDYLGLASGEGQTADLRTRLVALVAIDLRYRWRNSPTETIASRAPTESTLDSLAPLPSRPRLEDYLRRYPALGSLAELPESLVLAEYQARHAYGDMPSHVEYRERFPAIAARLDNLLTTVDESPIEQSSWLLAPPGVEMPVIPAINLDEFLARLAESRLFSKEEITAFQEELTPEEQHDSRALAERLLSTGRLTGYQAEAICQGQTKGLVLGDYTILDKLGAGGMGQVFKARHRTMERAVALKILLPRLVDSPDAVLRFRREVKATARLMHPNIAVAHDAGEHEGTHYLVTEYVEGQDLGKLVQKQGRLPVAEAVDYILQAARGLEYSHQSGVIHRDIKPSNLLVDRVGTVKILDLGLARLDAPLGREEATSSERLTASSQVMGTWEYIAPEQALATSKADHRADIYSLGCTLYRLLTGQAPYRGSTMLELFLAHREAPIPSLRDARPDVPEWLEVLYPRLVAKQPDDRCQSMGEVVAALASAQTGGGPCQSAVPACGPVVLVVLACMVACAILTLVLTRVGNRDPHAMDREETPSVRPTAEALPSPPGKAATPQPSALESSEPISGIALVTKPWRIPGVHSWSLETIASRGIIWAVAYRPDGKVLATGGSDGAIRLWDPSSGKLLRALLGHQSLLRSLAWTPDGRLLASSEMYSKAVKLWDPETGRIVKTLKTDESAFGLCWSPDGTRLGVGLSNGTIQIWRPATDELPLILRGHRRQVFVVAWSPNGHSLASAGEEGVLRLWEAETGKPLQSLEAPRGGTITALAFSPKGNSVACGHGMGTRDGWPPVLLWDLGEGKIVREFTFDRTGVHSLAFTPDGNTLAAGTYQGRHIQVWDVRTGKSLWAHEGQWCQGGRALAYSPDGSVLAVGTNWGTVHLWDAASGRALRELPGHGGDIRVVSFSHKGTELASVCNAGDCLVRYWDVASGRLEHESRLDGMPLALSWSPQGNTLGVAASRRGGVYSEPVVYLCDVASDRRLRELRTKDTVQSIAWSADGALFATGGRAGQLWSPSTGLVIADLPGKGNGLAFSPNGKWLAIGHDQLVRLCDVHTGDTKQELRGAKKNLSALAWSADGRILVGATDDNELCTWDAESGNLLSSRRPMLRWNGNPLLTWLDDQTTLVSGNFKTVAVWDMRSSQPLRMIGGHFTHGSIPSASPRLVAFSGQSLIRLHRIADGQLHYTILSLRDRQGGVLSPQGHYDGDPGIAKEFVYVVETDAGQETLAPAEFTKRFGWKNNPERARQGLKELR
jgi:WD40 repeat protein/serine/threonine protein kinase